jgi:hypothetical protein
MTAPTPGDPMNMYTVSLTDGTNTVAFQKIPARSKSDALIAWANSHKNSVASITPTSTWTITVTQP